MCLRCNTDQTFVVGLARSFHWTGQKSHPLRRLKTISLRTGRQRPTPRINVETAAVINHNIETTKERSPESRSRTDTKSVVRPGTQTRAASEEVCCGVVLPRLTSQVCEYCGSECPSYCRGRACGCGPPLSRIQSLSVRENPAQCA